MSTTRERADAACAKLTHDERLRDAETQSQWAIRRSRFARLRSKNERESVIKDAMSCLHGESYTMTCKKCRRDASEAKRNLDSLKLKLSIT